MKKLILLLLIAASFVGCKKSDPNSPNSNNGNNNNDQAGQINVITITDGGNTYTLVDSNNERSLNSMHILQSTFSDESSFHLTASYPTNIFAFQISAHKTTEGETGMYRELNANGSFIERYDGTDKGWRIDTIEVNLNSVAVINNDRDEYRYKGNLTFWLSRSPTELKTVSGTFNVAND